MESTTYTRSDFVASALQTAAGRENQASRLMPRSESAADNRTNFARAPVALLVLNADGLITDVSGRCLDLLGYGRQEVLGRHISDFQDETSAHQTIAGWDELLASVRPAMWSVAFSRATAASSACCSRRQWSSRRRAVRSG